MNSLYSDDNYEFIDRDTLIASQSKIQNFGDYLLSCGYDYFLIDYMNCVCGVVEKQGDGFLCEYIGGQGVSGRCDSLESCFDFLVDVSETYV